MKKIIAVLLALTMSLSMLAVIGFAADGEETKPGFDEVINAAQGILDVKKRVVDPMTKELNDKSNSFVFSGLNSKKDKELETACNSWVEEKVVGQGWDVTSLKAAIKYQYIKGYLTEEEAYYTNLALDYYINVLNAQKSEAEIDKEITALDKKLSDVNKKIKAQDKIVAAQQQIIDENNAKIDAFDTNNAELVNQNKADKEALKQLTKNIQLKEAERVEHENAWEFDLADQCQAEIDAMNVEKASLEEKISVSDKKIEAGKKVYNDKINAATKIKNAAETEIKRLTDANSTDMTALAKLNKNKAEFAAIKSAKAKLSPMGAQFTSEEAAIVKAAFTAYVEKLNPNNSNLIEWQTSVNNTIAAQENLPTATYDQLNKVLDTTENSKDIQVSLSEEAKTIVLAKDGESVVKVLKAKNVLGKDLETVAKVLYTEGLIDNSQLDLTNTYIQELKGSENPENKPNSSFKDAILGIIDGIFGKKDDEEQTTKPEGGDSFGDGDEGFGDETTGGDDDFNSNANGDLTVFAIAGTAAVAGVALLATRKKEEDIE